MRRRFSNVPFEGATYFRPLPAAATAIYKVSVQRLAISAHIGIVAEERQVRQQLIIDTCLLIQPPRADAITDTFDYRVVEAAAVSLGEQPIELIETFARRLAQACLAHPNVVEANITIEKPAALANGRAAVQIAMRRDCTGYSVEAAHRSNPIYSNAVNEVEER
jgi:dihydroneopterin aldolase